MSAISKSLQMGPSLLRGQMMRVQGVSVGALPQVDKLPRVVAQRGSKVTLHDRVKFFRGVQLHLMTSEATIEIGSHTYLNDDCRIYSHDRVEIGQRCAIAWEVQILDSDMHDRGNGRPMTSPVRIGNGVWIGSRATILKGVTVGDGAIIGAGSVVTRNVAPRSLVAGNPARTLATDQTWG